MPTPVKTTSLYDEASKALDAILKSHTDRHPDRDRLAVQNGVMRAIILAWAAQPSLYLNCLANLKIQTNEHQ
jgi:hypothetical protein